MSKYYNISDQDDIREFGKLPDDNSKLMNHCRFWSCHFIHEISDYVCRLINVESAYATNLWQPDGW